MYILDCSESMNNNDSFLFEDIQWKK